MPESTPEQGSIEVAIPVIATLAAKAASEVKGVVALAGGMKDELAKLIGRESLSRSVKVREEGEKTVSLDLHLIAAYKVSLPELSQKVSDRVRREVEALTQIKVGTVDVYIEDVSVPKEAHGSSLKAQG